MGEDDVRLSIFSAPTSTGVIMTMMALFDVKGSWVVRKASVLAVLGHLCLLFSVAIENSRTGAAGNSALFDLECLMPVLVSLGLLALAWFNIHKCMCPHLWPWVLLYASIIGIGSWCLEGMSLQFIRAPEVKWFHVAVLFPSFAFGCMISTLEASRCFANIDFELTEDLILRQERMESAAPFVDTFVGTVFMFSVGLNMPQINYSLASTSYGIYILHLIVVSILMLLGKLVVYFCYTSHDSKQRLGLALLMCPREMLFFTSEMHDVLSSQIAFPSVIINLLLFCVFAPFVNKLIADSEEVY